MIGRCLRLLLKRHEEVNGVFVVYAEGIVTFWRCYSDEMMTAGKSST